MYIKKQYDKIDINKQEITLEGNETVVENINRVIEYIQTHKILATKANRYFAMKQIKELNDILVDPIDVFSTRPAQKTYPNINGIYLILRTMGMLTFQVSKKETVMSVSEELLKSWQSLNPTEQYFTLLENWLIQSKPRETIEGSCMSLPLAEVIRFFTYGQNFSIERMIENFNFSPEYYNLALAKMFGFIDIIAITPTKKIRWNIIAIELNPLLKQILELMKPKDDHGLMKLVLNPPLRGYTKEIFSPYCKEFKNILEYQEEREKNGIFRLKISLGKVYRTIDITSEIDFQSLASTILELFDFDNDHLYEFRFIDNFGQQASIRHPENTLDDGKAWVDEFYLKNLPLEEQNSFTFIFDFGDCWEFDILIEKIDEGKNMDDFKLIKSVGKAPKQYPDYDEDW
ncbi:plasmid pRiA4b ORF-3 family protein [bacterium]|nr:plasmid pRiA4b ORF-3 family protein [bacterium]MBU1959413.1 plasmid pRiA4b ORF-3 family protein [bacterium]